jgi:MFS family permease
MAEAQAAEAEVLKPESDLSPRKLKIAFACLIGQTFATSILPASVMGFLMIPMTREFHWTRTQFSLGSTFLIACGAMTVWLFGRMTDKIGVRPVILAGTVAVGVITLAMSQQTASLWQFYAYYALLGVCGSSAMAYIKVIASLFTQHRGKAIAILSAEQTVLSAFLPLLTNTLLLNLGWRGMYVVYGAMILSVSVLLFFLLEEPVRLPKGANGAPPPMVLEGMTIREVLRDWVFWMIVFAGVVGIAIAGGMMTHMIAALIGKGFTQTQAASMTTLGMLVGVPGLILGGWLVDKYPTTKVAAPFNLLSAAGAVLLFIVTASVGGLPMLIASVSLGWFSLSAHRPMATYFHTRFFGLRAFTEVTGVQFTIIGPITAISAPIVGLIYDRTGSYDPVFILMMITPLLSGVVWLILPRYRYSANIGVVPATAPQGPSGEPSKAAIASAA